LLSGVIGLAQEDDGIIYTPVTREEEGIGILAGASLGGRRPAILMQNSGLGNCLNAICSLANYYALPLLLVVSHRGTDGERIEAQRPMGEATTGLVRAANVPFHVISRAGEINTIDRVLVQHWSGACPRALLFPLSYWNSDVDCTGTE
jgi:sulfopyruvate decarboxylase subunit alpha